MTGLVSEPGSDNYASDDLKIAKVHFVDVQLLPEYIFVP
jgi:hypothetical protein